jgi:hypothetical protein
MKFFRIFLTHRDTFKKVLIAQRLGKKITMGKLLKRKIGKFLNDIFKEHDEYHRELKCTCSTDTIFPFGIEIEEVTTYEFPTTVDAAENTGQMTKGTVVKEEYIVTEREEQNLERFEYPPKEKSDACDTI